jgi:dolichyl-phosphate beta-glucosyltransferase
MTMGASRAAAAGVCLIVPCYNEEHRLREQHFADLLVARDDASLCFVNDGSTDATFEILDTWREKYPGRIAVLNLETNNGKAEAVRQGVLYVLAVGPPDFLGYWDADISTPLSELGRMVAVLHGKPTCVLAMGSRVRRLGSVITRRVARQLLVRLRLRPTRHADDQPEVSHSSLRSAGCGALGE